MELLVSYLEQQLVMDLLYYSYVLNEVDAIMIRNIVETGYYNMNEELAEALRYELEKVRPIILLKTKKSGRKRTSITMNPVLI